LLEILESSKKSVIWTRVKYEEILEKIKSGKKTHCQDYYYRYNKCFLRIT
jgi:hypothetical protein